MELLFIRHAQGEHTLNLPNSLYTKKPSLTDKGITQARSLIEEFPLLNTDIIVSSPLRRTLQTALLWSEGYDCKKIVNP